MIYFKILAKLLLTNKYNYSLGMINFFERSDLNEFNCCGESIINEWLSAIIMPITLVRVRHSFAQSINLTTLEIINE